MLGLKRGAVRLCEHNDNWEYEAQKTIECLKTIIGDVATDIQHVGSTAVKGIKAKPIIDIAVAVDDFNDILAFEQPLKNVGFYYRPNHSLNEKNQLLFACGSFYDGTGDMQTHFIHVVHTSSEEWENYINFRDYLNATPVTAKEYEALKISLAVDNVREKYTQGKQDFILSVLQKASVESYDGRNI